ncbi:phosphoadenosine phosphosulfate reductase [Melioribacter roseus P3M-2]|uniref:Phosphoadenosine phosphosulfate reductase n=1 Tax=Melioribacter roseus (strain DSM 23840 / JCM 17771 / VKM B-2668 / P3M-2) TaxID=1191523 RepID=I6Z5C2_MELRP|nr:phosphoadenosine phosphosulfate reductase family protein [Melioribacter roseus]AFN74355.1 phosphoadenosine phosphosulfate reductase [Melioribacter roseus P3M-2]
MNKVRHVLGISGGKDSAALAVYLHDKYPQLEIEYYFCETDKELDETYKLIDNLESYLGKKIKRLKAAENSPEAQFDHFLKLYGGFLPSPNARWCTRAMKLEPFENYVGSDPTISYVGIRGDEDREGYISHKENIQSIFPFRKNIWSEEIIATVLDNKNQELLMDICNELINSDKKDTIINVLDTPLSLQYNKNRKLNDLLTVSISGFNKIVFEFLKTTNYPISQLDDFPLIENEDILVRDDIFKILEDSGVGVPEYYKKVEFEVDGKKGFYSRSRSGCYFCFFQQKIEWIWLYENHRELFEKAMSYEKDGYTWMQDERLEDIIKPERIKQIKLEQLKRAERNSNPKSPFLIDILEEAEGEGCAACFI